LGLSWRFYVALVVMAVIAIPTWITAWSALHTSVPPFEQLQRSEGVLDIEEISLRSGERTLLRKSDGTVEVYSCRDRDGLRHTCIFDPQRKWVGHKTVIWWFPMEIYPWHTDRRVAQMVIDGEIIVNYQRTVRKLESDKLWGIGISVFTFFLVVGIAIFEYLKARRQHHAT
jgi:hypothetical protein